MTRMAEKIQRLEGLLSTTPPGTNCHNEFLRSIADWYQLMFCQTNDPSDIEESLKYRRLSRDATHSGDTLKVKSRTSLYLTLNLAFKKTKKIGYLNELITVGYDIFEFTERSSQYTHFETVARLVQSLFIRERLLGRGPGEDSHEVVRLIPMVINNPYAHEPDRLRLSCQWAHAARSISHSTTLMAYKTVRRLRLRSQRIGSREWGSSWTLDNDCTQ